jgi:hypothetical protein
MPARYPQDRNLYDNEIARTDQTHFLMDRSGPGPATCRYCRNGDTQQIIGYAAKPFADYYEWRRFKAFSCFCCGAVWSYGLPTPRPTARNLGAYEFSVAAGYEFTVIRTQQAHHQWAFGQHNEFYSEATAAGNAARIAEYTERASRERQADADRRAVVRYLWWGSTDEPYYQATQRKNGKNIPETRSPLSYEMNPERIQCVYLLGNQPT